MTTSSLVQIIPFTEHRYEGQFLVRCDGCDWQVVAQGQTLAEIARPPPSPQRTPPAADQP